MCVCVWNHFFDIIFREYGPLYIWEEKEYSESKRQTENMGKIELELEWNGTSAYRSHYYYIGLSSDILLAHSGHIQPENIYFKINERRERKKISSNFSVFLSRIQQHSKNNH